MIRRTASPSFSRRIRQSVFLVLLLSLGVQGLTAQAASKRPLSFDDFDSWRSISGSSISRDGKFIAYVMQPQDGDGELFVKSTAGAAEWRAIRGYHPPTPPPDASDPEATAAFIALGRLLRPVFSADSKYVIFNIEPNKADVIKARREKKKPEDLPKNALGIMDLATGKVTRIDDVKSFQVPEDGIGYIAILKGQTKDPAAAPGENRSTATRETGASPSPTPVPVPSPALPAQSGPKKKDYGTTLILRSLDKGTERIFRDVLDYTFSKDGNALVYGVASRKEDSNGAFVVDPKSDAAPVALLKGAGKYRKFTWDEDQTQLAFISDRDDAAAKQPKFKVYHWPRKAASANEVVSNKTSGFRPDYVVSEKGALNFSYDGTRLFVSAAPERDPEPEAKDAAPDEEKVNVDLWHWKDDYIQPMQKVRAISDRDRSYRGVFHIGDGKFVQLGDSTMEGVNPSPNGLYAIGSDDRSYRIRSNYDPGYSDYYLIDTRDGSRKPLRTAQQFGMSWSPNSKYIAFFDGKDWNSISIPDGKVNNLTGKLGVKFFREDHDTPNSAPPYGIATWTKDDKQVLIYDRYDIWQIAADGSGGKLLTGDSGRREKTGFRYVRLDPDERFVSPDQQLLLRAENEMTRDSGFYRVRLDGSPVKISMDPKNYGNPVKAKDVERLMVTASRFDEFPDIWTTAGDYSELKKISNGNEQLAPFKWGTSELVNYKNTDGVALQGILIKPANFDANRKYPMLVYLYEKLSDTVHDFRNPGPGTSINLSYYASNDYVIFLPDIVYKIGYPGKSALNCVLPGIDSIVKMGFIDDKAIGIQGHSWGGYQIAYMITQTNRFRAAAPGALVANMFSAYNGVRWGSGMPRQFQYEHTQSRIGGTPWNSTTKFMENSPLFYIEKVQTPVLMLHNDGDDAVPWYQGIEFYLSLRRFGKEVYFFDYNGEPHGLRKRQNQKDYSRRMKEFFDNKLKGAPEPDWMKNGIRYIDRDKEKEKYRVSGPK